MSLERRRNIEDVFQSALKREPGDREKFLDETCGLDSDLRREVANRLLDSDLPETITNAGTTSQLGPYRLEGILGKGGMGEVHRALDTRLGRKVAVKICAARFSDRFEREARAIAALNHPNICILYDVGPNYLVMELVEGETLSLCLSRGKLAPELAARIALQVAGALVEAHARGVVHRDLKPGNIMITGKGAKVLDFGLARLADGTAEGLTVGHAVMGTPGYMAPEQREGMICDARTDIYALGLLTYEMFRGKRLEPGTAADLTGFTPGMAHVVERCLASDRDHRWQSARDLELELQWASNADSPTEHTPTRPRVWIGAAVALGIIVGAGAFWEINRSFSTPPVSAELRFRMPVPPDVHLATGETFSVSPDGKTLAYIASQSDEHLHLWAQSMDSLEPRVLPGTEIAGGNAPSFWSPDSKFVAFDSGGALKKADLQGSPPKTICAVPGLALGGSWSRDGVIIFGRDSGGISRVPAGGGDVLPVTNIDSSRGERNHVFPVFLPDGHHFLYLRTSTIPENNGIYVGSIDAKPSEQGLKQLLSTPFAVRVVPSADGNARILFFREGGTLWSQELNLPSMEMIGEPVRIAEHLGKNRVFGFFAASENGYLIYRSGSGETSQMTWFDRKGVAGRAEGLPSNPHGPFTLSPTQSRVAVSRYDASGVDLWIRDLVRGTEQRLTSDPAIDTAPIWSRDGGQVAFCSARSGFYDLYRISSQGDGQERLLLRSAEDKCPSSWSPDGNVLLFHSTTARTSGDIWLLPLGTGGKAVPLLNSRFNESSAVFSPNGKSIAFVSDEGGAPDVYVQKFGKALDSDNWLSGPKVSISRGGGTFPHWRADGRELFYRAGNGTLTSVAWNGDTLQPGSPEPLFPVSSSWDVSGDGKRFLVAVPVDHASAEPFTVVTDWQAALKK